LNQIWVAVAAPGEKCRLICLSASQGHVKLQAIPGHSIGFTALFQASIVSLINAAPEII
jgi:hypothetical protein